MTHGVRPTPAGSLVVGVDFGTLSARAVVVTVADGRELGTGTCSYAHGVLDRRLRVGDVRLPPDWALQVPADYREALGVAVRQALADAGADPLDVIGIGTDFTSSTMVPTTADGTPLNEVPGLEGEPHAYVKLWRHHAAQDQADRITELARARQEAWLPRYGGRVSSEWQLPKALQMLEEAPRVHAAMDRYVEAADWIVWQLCGHYVRNACSAGYKGLHQDGTYPSSEFLAALEPELAGFVREKLEHPAGRPLGRPGDLAGHLSAAGAELTGLPEGIAVAVGNVDAHVSVVAANATGPGRMVAVLGTSTCLLISSETRREVPGMCGVVDGGLVPGFWGYEAGQSGVGDVFDWFVSSSVPAAYAELATERGLDLHELLTDLARGQQVGEHGLLALDWHSGNRSVLVDHELSGLLVGQSLATRPEDGYRALLEATAFGARRIIEAFEEAGIAVDELVVTGGLVKNSLLLQVYADVTDLPLSTIASSQAPALGSAILAAVAAGAHSDVRAAATVMGSATTETHRPIPANVAAYDELYREYRTLHDYFGTGTNEVMHRLKAIRRAATGAP